MNTNTRSANMSRTLDWGVNRFEQVEASLAFVVRLESFSFQECSLIPRPTGYTVSLSQLTEVAVDFPMFSYDRGLKLQNGPYFQ